MKFLCLIRLNEQQMEAMPEADMDALNARHLDLNDDLRKSGHFIEAEALEPARAAARLRLRGGQATVVDGPFAETKEVIAGFYLIEARDRKEALQVAARIPSAPLGTVEVWPTRQLVPAGTDP